MNVRSRHLYGTAIANSSIVAPGGAGANQIALNDNEELINIPCSTPTPTPQQRRRLHSRLRLLRQLVTRPRRLQPRQPQPRQRQRPPQRLHLHLGLRLHQGPASRRRLARDGKAGSAFA